MLEPITIKATDLSDAWHQTLFKCVEVGQQFVIDRGSNAGQKRCELDFITVHITRPGDLPLLPKVNPALNIPDPVAPEYLDDYMPYLMTGAEKEGESYTYGKRICGADAFGLLTETGIEHIVPEAVKARELPENVIWKDPETGYPVIDQMELMIWTYKNKGHRNNQMILQVAQPTDMALISPPCLRHIDTRIQDGALHFFPYFRSWDLFGGFPANLAAIELMKQYCAGQIGVKNGEIIATSKGLHLYDYVWEISEMIRGKKMDAFRPDAPAPQVPEPACFGLWYGDIPGVGGASCVACDLSFKCRRTVDRRTAKDSGKGVSGMKHVIILNGAPRAGKGTFAAMFGDNAEIGSIINGSKNIAKAVFEWDGVKDTKGRKLLADLYLASMAYDKAPLKEILALVLSSRKEVIIIDVRDPDVIRVFENILDMIGVKCTAVLVRRDSVDAAAEVDGLPIDCRTAEGDYDMVFHNNSTIEHFREGVYSRFSDLLPEPVPADGI